MSRRPLVFVSGLTVGDYLLWNWSLNGNHDVLALVSGLTLPPLASPASGSSPERRAPARALDAAPGQAQEREHAPPAGADGLAQQEPATATPARPPASSPPERPPHARERPSQAPAPPLQASARRRRGAACWSRRPSSAATSTSATAPAASTTRTRASSPSRRPRSPPAAPTLRLAALRLQQGTHALLPRARDVRPPFRRLWVRNSHSLLEFPPVIYGDASSSSATTASSARSTSTPATPSGQRRTRPALRLLPAAVTANTVYATVLASGHADKPGRSRRAQLRQRADPLVPRAAQPERVLAAARPTAASSSAPRTAPSTRSTPATATSSGPTTRPARSRPARRSSGGILYFGDYSGHVQAISERTGRRHLGQRLRRRAARQRHLLLDRRRLLRPRLPRQHRRAHLRLRRVHRQPRLGRADRRLRLRLARRHQRARPRPDHLPRLLQRHLLRPQRPLRHVSWRFNAGRAHLRLGDDRRARRLLRRPRQPPHLRPRHLHRPRRCSR